MGLARRQFNKEFKLAAVRRLEQGVSIAEAARALEVSPHVLHRWRRSSARDPGMLSLAKARHAGPRAGSPSWSRRSVSRPWRSIF